MALIAFAALSAGNGIYRYASDPDRGRTGLVFGLTMAALAGAAFALHGRSPRAARLAAAILAGSALLMTGGFFAFALAAKPDQYGVVRPALMIAASLGCAACLLRRR